MILLGALIVISSEKERKEPLMAAFRESKSPLSSPY